MQSQNLYFGRGGGGGKLELLGEKLPPPPPPLNRILRVHCHGHHQDSEGRWHKHNPWYMADTINCLCVLIHTLGTNQEAQPITIVPTWQLYHNLSCSWILQLDNHLNIQNINAPPKILSGSLVGFSHTIHSQITALILAKECGSEECASGRDLIVVKTHLPIYIYIHDQPPGITFLIWKAILIPEFT